MHADLQAERSRRYAVSAAHTDTRRRRNSTASTGAASTKPAALNEDALAAALVSSGLVAQNAVERLRGQDARGRRLYRALIEEKLATEIGLRDLMSRTFNLPPVDLKTMEIDSAAASALRPQFLRERMICPVVTQPDRLTLAVADPTDKATIDEAERVTRKKLRCA